jgi:hypothetical protein
VNDDHGPVAKTTESFGPNRYAAALVVSELHDDLPVPVAEWSSVCRKEKFYGSYLR